MDCQVELEFFLFMTKVEMIYSFEFNRKKDNVAVDEIGFLEIPMNELKLEENILLSQYDLMSMTFRNIFHGINLPKTLNSPSTKFSKVSTYWRSNFAKFLIIPRL